MLMSRNERKPLLVEAPEPSAILLEMETADLLNCEPKP